MAERVLGNVVSSGIKVLVLAVIVSIGSTLFSEFTDAIGTAQPAIEDAMAIVLGALCLLGLGIFGPRIASGIVSGGPQLGAGAAAGTSERSPLRPPPGGGSPEPAAAAAANAQPVGESTSDTAAPFPAAADTGDASSTPADAGPVEHDGSGTPEVQPAAPVTAPPGRYFRCPPGSGRRARNPSGQRPGLGSPDAARPGGGARGRHRHPHAPRRRQPRSGRLPQPDRQGVRACFEDRRCATAPHPSQRRPISVRRRHETSVSARRGSRRAIGGSPASPPLDCRACLLAA